MGDKIFIGNLSDKGLQKYLLPFNIDNDAFATLYNFYTWRGRVKKKRGTVPLGRLTRQIQVATSPTNWQLPTFSLTAGAGNLITQTGIESTSSIVPGLVSLTVSAQTYTDPAMSGILIGSSGGSGTINYATGAFTISGGAASAVIGTFSYYPNLPVLGLRELVRSSTFYPLLLAFDQKYAYQITNTSTFYSVSYYKNSNNPVVWHGQNYQQFWTTNYQSSLWATNNNAGMIFENISAVTVGATTTITTATDHGLVSGDYVWFNEITGADAATLNLKSAVVTVVTATTFTVPIVTTGLVISNNGIFQILTGNPNVAANTGANRDGIKWYDGDPTSNSGLPVANGLGWVNFAPPLTSTSVSIDFETSKKYYLVGALAILPFKDRLVFFKPWIQASDGTAPVQLIDVAMWSWNGTPYYNELTPANETSDPTAYYVDQTGKGGWLSAGINQSISTVSPNEDVLLVGFSSKQSRFVYTGNDLFPFLFYITNSELGSAATFSSITLDKGVLSFGLNGLTIAAQIGAERIDLSIPDQVFQIKGPATVNATERISAARDFFREWVYFTFVPNTSQWSYPTLTLLYNYRESTWSFQYENFTAHGIFRKQSGYTWATIPFRTWSTWRESWNSATTTALFPSVVAGTPQGFVVIKGQGTGEAPTGYVSAVASASGFVQITSNDHCVAINDYLYFQGMLGTTYLNTQIGQVKTIIDANNFVVDTPFQAGTYLGLGVFTRLIQPLLQTKQFAPYWDQGKQVRLGVQKYLMDYTDNAQVTLNIYLSQNPDNAWNDGPIIPDMDSVNNSLVYSDILFTCPETNNLQTPTATSQYQIWHRMNTSLIGESFQIGITLSDAQMRNLNFATEEITLHAIQCDVDKAGYLA